MKLAESDAAGKPTGPVVSQRLVLQPTAAGQAVTLPFKPTTAGLHTVSVWVDPIPGERTTADNRQTFQGLALDPRIKVLYVEGSVRLEYKWTRLAFLSDANIELATYLRKTATSVEAGGHGRRPAVPGAADDGRRVGEVRRGRDRRHRRGPPGAASCT